MVKGGSPPWVAAVRGANRFSASGPKLDAAAASSSAKGAGKGAGRSTLTKAPEPVRPSIQPSAASCS